MEMTGSVRLTGLPVWLKQLASLLPVWLLAAAITVEGFPAPPISPGMAAGLFGLALVLGLVFLFLRWMPLGFVLYGLLIFWLIFIFDEISTAYKTPFILICAMILSAGMLAYFRLRTSAWRWLVLLAAAVLVVLAAWNAAGNFWQMTAELGYHQCFPDAAGCPPLAGRGQPWWVLFWQ